MISDFDLLKSLSQIVREAEGDLENIDWQPEDESFGKEPEMGAEPAPEVNSAPVQSGDPVQDLADFLESTPDKGEPFTELIAQFLKDNNLEIVPMGGLTDDNGEI